MEEQKQQWVLYLEKASVAILGLLFIFFPLIFSNITTDVFLLPKQIFLIFSVIVLMLLFIGVVTLSVVFSVAKLDSLFNFVPLLFAVILFFAITYNVRDKKSLNVLVASLLIGGALVSVLTLFNFLKIYVLPFEFAKFQAFTTLGSMIDQAIYLGFVFSLGAYFVIPSLKKGKSFFSQSKQDSIRIVGYLLISLIILIGLSISIYSLIILQKPLILPVATGFQTAFAAISQDGGRVIQGFLFGSGYGEFANVFLRFKHATFNSNADIWGLTFFRSTSYVLELLATTGMLGVLSFLLLCYRIIKQKPLFIPLVIIVLASFILPFAFYHIALMFFILGIYSVLKGLSNHQDFFDVELQLVASKKGFFVLSSEEGNARQQEKYGKILASIIIIIVGIFSLIFGSLTFDFAKTNVTFQKSVVSANQNNGQQTYDYQTSALNSVTGKYVDAYHRVFSQTNLALANSIANSVPKGSSPSAETTQTIYTLVQQSINSARNATTISRNNAVNWQNLSSIYRSLIGFGQSADSFAILAAQQAINLDPTNPQEYINLGGIYYQIKAFDKALEQFQIAKNLKPDLANAYYNHAHALIEKGDLSSALTELNSVKSLVKDDKTSLEQLNNEIKQLEEAIAKGGNQPTSSELAQPQSALPKQNPQVEIPGPTASITPTPTKSITPTTTPEPTQAQ